MSSYLDRYHGQDRGCQGFTAMARMGFWEGHPGTPMTRVLIADNISPCSIEIFHSRGIDCDVKTDLDHQALCQVIKAYEGLIVRSATQVTHEVLSAGKSLKIVGRAGIGIDNIDLQAATALGIVVMNTPFW